MTASSFPVRDDDNHLLGLLLSCLRGRFLLLCFGQHVLLAGGRGVVHSFEADDEGFSWGRPRVVAEAPKNPKKRCGLQDPGVWSCMPVPVSALPYMVSTPAASPTCTPGGRHHTSTQCPEWSFIEVVCGEHGLASAQIPRGEKRRSVGQRRQCRGGHANEPSTRCPRVCAGLHGPNPPPHACVVQPHPRDRCCCSPPWPGRWTNAENGNQNCLSQCGRGYGIGFRVYGMGLFGFCRHIFLRRHVAFNSKYQVSCQGRSVVRIRFYHVSSRQHNNSDKHGPPQALQISRLHHFRTCERSPRC